MGSWFGERKTLTLNQNVKDWIKLYGLTIGAGISKITVN